MKGRIKRLDQEGGIKLPRIGFIKTGYKDGNKPRSVDYFIAAGKYKALFDKAYGQKPQKIHIVFWDDEPATSCHERYEYRDGQGRLYARGDGQDFEVWNAQAEKYEPYSKEDHPDIMERVHDKVKAKGWDVILTLRFILPVVRDIAGYWEYTTRGEASSIPAIRDTFDAIQQSRGSVAGVVFDMNVEFIKSQKPGSKSRYPVVNIVPNQTPENIEAVKGSFLQIESHGKKENGDQG